MSRRAVVATLSLAAAASLALALAAPSPARPAERHGVIVTGIDVGGAHSAVGAFGVRHRLPLIGGFSANLTDGQVRSLERRPGVRVEQVTTVHVTDDGTTHDFGVAAARADRQTLDGAGVGICVVDTGVNPTHEQIAPRTVTFRDFVGTATMAYDDQGHGTHVMSIAAGDGTAGDGTGGASAPTFIGVAPAATLFAAKVLDSSGSGPNDRVVAGVQWCASQPGVRVISMSLGDPDLVPNGLDALSQAVNAAAAGGDAVVVAAGNSGDLPGTINSPGAATGAITVGAVSDYSNPAGTDRHDNGIWLAAFSSRGPTTDGRTKPDIAGPGVTVRAAQAGTTSGYVTMSGTSMATPFVAGAVALGLQANPTATPAQVKAGLVSSALDVGATGTDNEYGAGYIDVRAFVDTLAGTATPRHTDFPVQQHVSGVVPDFGSYDIPIVVPTDGVGVPLAVTVTLAGDPICYIGTFPNCFYAEWSPDVDLQLRQPNGTVVATSRCALAGLACVTGRQETIGVTPTAAGTWVLHLYPDTGTNNNGKGGAFTADISHGPVGTTVPPPPPPPPANTAPIANAGPDQSVRVRGKTASFTLNGSGSSDPDGDPLTYRWNAGGTVVGTTATVTLKRAVGTYTFTLTVSDGRGGTSTDQVTVALHK